MEINKDRSRPKGYKRYIKIGRETQKAETQWLNMKTKQRGKKSRTKTLSKKHWGKIIGTKKRELITID